MLSQPNHFSKAFYTINITWNKVRFWHINLEMVQLFILQHSLIVKSKQGHFNVNDLLFQNQWNRKISNPVSCNSIIVFLRQGLIWSRLASSLIYSLECPCAFTSYTQGVRNVLPCPLYVVLGITFRASWKLDIHSTYWTTSPILTSTVCDKNVGVEKGCPFGLRTW